MLLGWFLVHRNTSYCYSAVLKDTNFLGVLRLGCLHLLDIIGRDFPRLCMHTFLYMCYMFYKCVFILYVFNCIESIQASYEKFVNQTCPTASLLNGF